MERLSLNTKKNPARGVNRQLTPFGGPKIAVLAGQVIVRGCGEAVRRLSGFQMGEFVANLAMFPGEGVVRLKIIVIYCRCGPQPSPACHAEDAQASKHACAGQPGWASTTGGSRPGKLNNVTMQSGGFII
jgi:hypothetical protein